MDDVGTTAKDTQAFIASLEWLHPLTGGLDERHPLSLSTASNDVYCGPTHKKFVPAIFLDGEQREGEESFASVVAMMRRYHCPG